MDDFWTGEIQTSPPDDGVSGYVKPTSFGENFNAAIKAENWANSQGSQAYAFDEVRRERDAKIVKLTGKPLPDIGSSIFEDGNASYATRVEAYKKQVREAAAQFPNDVFDDDALPEKVYQRTRDSEIKAAQVGEGAGAWGVVGSVAGSMVGSLNPRTNPLNFMTLPLGWGRTAVQRVLANTGLAGVTETINQFNGVNDWRKEAGLDNSIDRALSQVLFAAGGAGALSAAGEGVAYGAKRLLGKTDTQIKKMQEGRQTTAAENAFIQQAETLVRTQELGQIQDSDLHSLATTWLKEATSDERAAIHALDESMATKQTIPYAEGQPGRLAAHEKMLNETIQGISQPEGVLREAPAPLPPSMDQFGIKKPDDILVDVNDLVLDPKRFQFKSDTDSTGANETLKKVTEWNPHLGGTITIFQGLDDKLYVADGHQRINLAKRLISTGQEKGIMVRANVLREGELGMVPGAPEPIVWSPQSAMAYAASFNMIQGTGSVLDAAKVLRVAPEYLAELSNNALTRDARGLSKLSDDAFAMAVNNSNVNASHASLVGQIIDDPKLHTPVLRQLLEEGPETLFQAESMIRQMRDDAFTSTTQETLFGTEELVESLYKPKAKVLDRAIKILRDDKKIFATLGRNSEKIEGTGKNTLDKQTNAEVLNEVQMALHNVQKLAYRKGDVSDALTAAAKQAKESGNYSKPAREFAETIRQAIARGDITGDAAGVVTDAYSPRTTQGIGEDVVSTGARQTEARLGLDTDALAREVGLNQAETPASARSLADGAGEARKSAKENSSSGGGDTQEVPSQIVQEPSARDMRDKIPSTDLYSNLISDIGLTPYKSNIRQFERDYKANLALAEKSIGNLRTLMGEVVNGVDGAHVAGARVKKIETPQAMERMMFKLKSKGGDGRLISDYLGGRIVVDNPDALQKIIIGIKAKGVRIVEAENKMAKGYDKNGWRDVSMQVEIQKGFTAELQITTSKLLEISDGPGHKIYERWRNTPMGESNPEKVRDYDAMKKLYDEAWDEFQQGKAIARPAEKPIEIPAEYADLEIPSGIDIDPQTGETIARTMTMRELAEIVQDGDALAKAARECAI